MERCLKVGDTVSLTSAGSLTEFTVKSVIGQGGSCIAYKVWFKENGNIIHTGILKEFYPAFLVTDKDFVRTEQEISVPEWLRPRFEEELAAFKDTYRVINEYLANNVYAANYHPVFLGLYYGNGTVYNLTSFDYGVSMDKYKAPTLAALLRVMISVTKGVEQYHNAGFLHLDIKPRNILILDEVTDIVKLFDYDSLMPIKSFVERTARTVPIPGEFYVPELVGANLRNIRKSTDVFEIGAVLFCNLFGRAPTPADMRYDSVYPFGASPLTAGVSPKVKHEMEALFRSTLQITVGNRYPDTVELRKHLEKLLGLVADKSPHLKSLPAWQPTPGVMGRQADAEELHERLEKDGYVFVKGGGGVGKTELAKYYCKRFGAKYHTVQFCRYEDNLRTLIASIEVEGIDDDAFDSFEELVKAKLAVLHNADSRTLLVVDNFNVSHDKMLRDFIPQNEGSFRVIFTTRCTLAADYFSDKIMELKKLSEEYSIKLFSIRSGISEDDALLPEVISRLGNNVLMLKLLSQATRDSGKTAAEILELLDNNNYDSDRTLAFYDYGFSPADVAEYGKLDSYLNAIFELDTLSEAEKELLKNMTLVPQSGVPVATFLELCGNEQLTEAVLEDVIEKSWIETYDDRLYMHPVLSDLVSVNEGMKKKDGFYCFANFLEELCAPEKNTSVSEIVEKLAYAIQLDKRYKRECTERLINIKLQLGALFFRTGRSKRARTVLLDAERISKDKEKTVLLPYIYSYLAQVEKYFGLPSAAIDWYDKAVSACNKQNLEQYKLAIESWMGIGECLVENGDLDGAIVSHNEALYLAQLEGISNYIYDAARKLVRICRDRDDEYGLEKYYPIMVQYKNELEEEPEELDDIFAMESFLASAKISDGVNAYERFLEKRRDELGEASPAYQAICRNRWLYYAMDNDSEQAKRLVAVSLAFTEEKHGANSHEMAYQLMSIAQAFPKLGEIEYAINCAKRAVEICTELNARRSKTAFFAFVELIKTHSRIGERDKALEYLKELDLSDSLGEDKLSYLIRSIGICLCELGKLDVAEKLASRLLKKGNGELLGKLQSYLVMATVKEQRSEFYEAKRYCRLAKELLDTVANGAVRDEWSIYYCRLSARILYREGNSAGALELLTNMVNRIFDTASMDVRLLPVYNDMGVYAFAGSLTEEANKYFTLCMDISEKYNLPEQSLVGVYGNLCAMYSNAGDFETADIYAKKAEKLYPGILNPVTLTDSITCGNMAWVAFNRGDVKKAGLLASRAANAMKRLGAKNCIEYVSVLYTLGLAYARDGKYDKCIKVCEDVYKALGENDLRLTEERRLSFFSLYTSALFKEARREQVVALAEKEESYFSRAYGAHSEGRIYILIILGAALRALGREECVVYFTEANYILVKFSLTESRLYAELQTYYGVYYLDMKKDEKKAIECFGEAKATFERLGETESPLYKQLLRNIEIITGGQA